MDIANMGASSVLSAGQGLANTGMNYWMAQKSREHSKIDQKEMGNFNYGLEMNKWRDTNYGPQMEEMRKAGLNPSMMYGGGGGSGQGATSQTIGGGQQMAGKVEGGGMDIGTMMAQQSMMELQKSQSEKLKAETNKLKGVDTDKTVQEVENLKISVDKMVEEMGLIGEEKKGQEWKNEILEIESRVAGATEGNVVRMVSWEVESLRRNVERMNKEIEGKGYENEVSKRTIEGNVEMVNLTIDNLSKDMLLKDSKIALNEAQAKEVVAKINEIVNSIRQRDEGLYLEGIRTATGIEKIRTDVMTQLKVAKWNNTAKIEAAGIGKEASVESSGIIKSGMINSSLVGSGGRIVGGVIDNVIRKIPMPRDIIGFK